MWEAVADVHFVAAASSAVADVLLQRGATGGDYESGDTYLGSGATLGGAAAQAVISIQTSQTGFDLSGSFDVVAAMACRA